MKDERFPSLSSFIFHLSSRRGVSLVELLLFVGLLALMSGALVGFFLLTSDTRVRQQVVSDVEQNVIQLHQFLAYEIRHAERVIDPPLGESGSVLTLRSRGVDSDPVIIAVQSGFVLLIRKDAEYVLSPPEVVVSDFRVHNTSPSDARASVAFSFLVSKQIPIPGQAAYERRHDGAVTVLPDDAPTGNACGCAAPRCDHGLYEWETCEAGACIALSGSVLCPR
jgi:type II secretory pathway pseudopilin PulG